MMLKKMYHESVVNKLVFAAGYKNLMKVPKIVKVCVSVGIPSQCTSRDELFEYVIHSLGLIVGQKPVVTYAKKSISGFKIRKGDKVGCMVTLRKDIMCNFLEKLLFIALPREKDFKGFTVKQFDGNGNLSFGVKEHIIFSEINYEGFGYVFGMNITVVTSADNDADAKLLLENLYFPFCDS